MSDLENICKICNVASCRWDACDVCKKAAKVDPRVTAIHAHKLVGHGTNTSIDECHDDHELVIYLNENGADTEEKAIKWALENEGLWLENATNYRWGEDSDPELKHYKDWQKKVGELS